MVLMNENKDHWAFLEEIEAPMWVDLTLETESNRRDNNDEWFCSSHPFHQCSSRQLKSMFARSGEGSTTLDFDLQGPSSPKLPSSVSRSRGKHYRSKKWRGENCDVSLNNPHPVKVLSGKSSLVDIGGSEKIKPKLSFINVKGTSKSKTSLVSERKLTGNAKAKNMKPISTSGVVKSDSISVADNAGESNTSTVTSESSQQQQQQKNLEVSSRAFGSTSGLLSAMKITLRKSCVTRPASRVEIHSDRRQSRDRKSSTSKSSVGSSSYPDYNAKGSTFTSIRNKERTPDSRNVTRMSEEAKNRVKVSNVSRASTAQVKEGTSNSRRVGLTNVAKASHQEVAKPKLQYQNLRAKALLPHGPNEQDSSTGATKAREKMRASGPSRLAGAGKENATTRISVSQKCSGRDTTAGVMVRGQKGTKQNVPQKGDRTGLVGPKGKISVRSERENSTNGIQRLHLR